MILIILFVALIGILFLFMVVLLQQRDHDKQLQDLNSDRTALYGRVGVLSESVKNLEAMHGNDRMGAGRHPAGSG